MYDKETILSNILKDLEPIDFTALDQALDTMDRVKALYQAYDKGLIDDRQVLEWLDDNIEGMI